MGYSVGAEAMMDRLSRVAARRTLAACVVALAAVTGAAAQPPAPRAPLSPHETKAFDVEGAAITIKYGRPSMRGRKIFGGLRQYGVLWMPGADEATRVDTTADLQFGGVRVPKGAYTIYTIPTETTWTLIINKQTGQFHTVYNRDMDLARLEMKTERLTEPVEQLTISATSAAGGGGVFAIEWETTRAFVPFTVVR
jgi:hypothetical protein